MHRSTVLPLAALTLAAATGAAAVSGAATPAAPAPTSVSSVPVEDLQAPAAPGSAQDARGTDLDAVTAAAQAYVDTVNAADLDALAASFAPDAVVTDVRRPIEGRDAIRAWADREVIGGSLRVLDVVEDRPDGQLLLVHWAPGGTGGWRAHYDFTVAGGLVVAADLQYA